MAAMVLPQPLGNAAKQARIAAIRRALARAGGNVSAASRALGYAEPGCLFRAMRRYGIKAAEYRKEHRDGSRP